MLFESPQQISFWSAFALLLATEKTENNFKRKILIRERR